MELGPKGMEAGRGHTTLTPALPQSNFQLLASAARTVLVAASLFDAHLLAWPGLTWPGSCPLLWHIYQVFHILKV